MLRLLSVILLISGAILFGAQTPPMVPMVGFITPSSGGGLPTNLLFSASGTTNGGTYNLGTPAANRQIIVVGGVQASGTSHVFSGMVINGVTASRAVLAQEGTSPTANTIEIWSAFVPMGSSGVITITAPGATGIGIAVYTLYASSASPHLTNSNSNFNTNISTSVGTVSGGFFVAASQWTNGTSSWSGTTKDGSDIAVGGNHASFAHSGPNSGSTANVTANISCGCGGVAAGIVIASWSP